MRSAEDSILDLPDYLDHLGLERFAPLQPQPPCELCGCVSAVTLRETVRVTDSLRTRFSTLSCDRCGLMFQSPRFASGFYDAYYAQVYRLLVGGCAIPGDAYVADQIARGEALFASLQPWLPARDRLLDVGCGTGGMMKAFLRRGWSALGVDPDEAATAYAVNRLSLPVTAGSAETMVIERNAFDLIVIAGSLEHVHDPNATLRRCHDAAAAGSLLLLEAHGLGQATQLGVIGHNHRRLLTGASLALLMLRHGWQVEWITHEPLCGPTRPGSVFALGRRSEPVSPETFQAAIADGLRDRPEALTTLLDELRID